MSTPAALDAVHRLRHLVYCREKRWLDVRSDERERDPHDEWSTHFAGLDAQGDTIASARVIDGTRSPMGLPIQHHPGLVAAGIELETRGWGEVSRFLIRPDWRGRGLVLRLYEVVFRHAFEDEYVGYYVQVEPPFLAAMERFGFRFETIGPPGFHMGGLIVPCRIRRDTVGHLVDLCFGGRMRGHG